MSATSPSHTSATNATQQRPLSVTRGVYLAVASFVVGLPAPLLPGADEIPDGVLIIGAVLTVVALIFAWGLWNLTRWGGVGTLVITALNTLSALPGLFDPPSAWLVALIIVVAVLSVAAMALLLRKDARVAYWSRG